MHSTIVSNVRRNSYDLTLFSVKDLFLNAVIHGFLC